MQVAHGFHPVWQGWSGQHLHTSTSGEAATGAHCTSDGDGICASSNAGFFLKGIASRQTLAPALVARLLLSLLARPLALLVRKCIAGFTRNGISCQESCFMPSPTGYGFTGAGGPVTTRLLGLLARPMAMVLVHVATQASHWLAMNVRLTLAPALVAPRLLGWARGNACPSGNAGFFLKGSASQANTCADICGTTASGASCTTVSDSMWASCNACFTLNSNACQGYASHPRRLATTSLAQVAR